MELKTDMEKIEAIVDATILVLNSPGTMNDAEQFRSDLTLAMELVHLKTPLRLDDMVGICMENINTVNMDMFNVVHDVIGIHNHIDRDTGILDNTFMPRFLLIGG